MTRLIGVGVGPVLTAALASVPEHHVTLLDASDALQFVSADNDDPMPGFDGDVLPDVVMLGEEVPIDESLMIAQELDARVPAIELMLVADPDTDLALRAMRVGIREIVSPQITPEELEVLLQRAGAGVAARLQSHLSGESGHVAESRVIVVASPKGGVGKSMIAANLAVELARRAPMETVLVDLDIQFGDAATLLNLDPIHTIADAFGASAAMDTLILKTFLTVHSSGFYVLCGAETPTLSDVVTGANVKRLLHQLSSQFRNVIVDTSSGLSEHTLAALEEAHVALLVSSMDVASIRALRRELDVLSELGLLPAARHAILNFFDRRSGLTVRDVEGVIGMPVDVVVPRSPEVPIAGNRGEPAALKKRSPVAKAIQGLAAKVEGEETSGSWLGGRRRKSGEHV